MITSAAALAIDTYAVPVTRTRRAAGAYVAGVFTPGAATTATIQAAIFAITPRALQDLPEGIRSDAKWTAWSRSDLRTAAGDLPADTLTWQGATWRVIHVWPRIEGEFTKATLGGPVEAAR